PAAGGLGGAGGRPADAAGLAARDSYGRLLALLYAPASDLAAAEDALGDAFERALRTWPARGGAVQPRRVAAHRRPQPAARPLEVRAGSADLPPRRRAGRTGARR